MVWPMARVTGWPNTANGVGLGVAVGSIVGVGVAVGCARHPAIIKNVSNKAASVFFMASFMGLRRKKPWVFGQDFR